MSENQPNPPAPETPKCPQCGTPLPAGALAGLCPACLLKQGATQDTATQPETPPFIPPPVEEIARLFPQLEIIRLLGKGGMGAVYQARQPALDRLVALKILPAHSASDPGFAERFTREARALARLSHPNIVTVHEFGLAGELHYFIMEFVDGVNLRQLQRAGQLSPREALQIVPQLCDALQYAHDQGVVHRDIKPENVLIDRKGRVKVADFGLAKMLGHDTGDTRLTGEGHVMGTLHYMSPEQLEHPLEVDHRADIYSLGVVFYELLTGELPLGRFQPPSSKVLIDIRLDDVVLRALAREPDRRYQQASQVKTAMENIASTGAPPPLPSAAAMTNELLARDYYLDIGFCLRRGWNLVRSDFWPIVGVTALIIILSSLAGSNEKSSILGLLLSGPLMGGLYLHYLKKIRGEPSRIETAFSGFSHFFLHLFLGSFVVLLLTGLGYVCFVLPGIYLTIAWMFTLPLIIDKRLEFWPAMELSRRIVSMHWFKFLWFGIVLVLVAAVGFLACGVGILITIPIALASMMYAYEDVFGGLRPATSTPPAMAFGPTGTVVTPPAAAPGASAGAPAGSPAGVPPLPPRPPRPASAPINFMPAVKVAGKVLLVLILIGVAIAAISGIVATHHSRVREREMLERAEVRRAAAALNWSPKAEKGEKPDLAKILEEAKALTVKGSYDEALQHYLWFHKHAAEYDPAQNAVRLSFALFDWVELGRRYPKATDALTEIRDQAAHEFSGGRGYFDLFMELASINRELQDDDSTIEAFKQIPYKDRVLSRQCFPLVESILVKHQEYQLCMNNIEDADATFEGIRDTWQRQKNFELHLAAVEISSVRTSPDNDGKTTEVTQPPPSPEPPALPPKTADKTFIAQTRQLVEILIGTDHKDEAIKIRDRAFVLLPDESLQAAVTDAEAKTGR